MRPLLAIALLAALSGVAPAAAQEELTPAERAALDGLSETHATVFELVDSWFQGRPIQYYDFGPSPVDAGVVYRVRGGGDIVSSVPGLDGYTTLRQVIEVHLAGSTQPSGVRSQTEVLRLVALGEARLVLTGMILNLPVVPAGSTLERDPESRELQEAWYKGIAVRYYDFGPTRPATTPLIAFGAIGPDGEIEIRQPTNVSSVPGVPGYTDIWAVTMVLGGKYPPGSYRDYRRALGDSRAGRFDEVRPRPPRNCPVVYIDGRPAPRGRRPDSRARSTRRARCA